MVSPSGTIEFHKPVAYQISAGGKTNVSAKFHLTRDNQIQFELGEYDHSQALVIDPVITFATYLAGTGADHVTGVATDGSGNVFVTGYTTSTDFPTKNPIQSGLGGSGATNVFITKLDPTGKTLIYSTYLGGSSTSFGDFGGAITVDSAGNAIVGGIASSSNFPHAGSVPSTVSCQYTSSCYFIASIKPDGSGLNYAGRIGGEQGNYTNGVNGRVAVDASGNAYLAGVTDDRNFNVTPGTLGGSPLGYPYNQMFVLKVDTSGGLVYSTIVPGNASNSSTQSYTNAFLPTAIAVDSGGSATVLGWGGLGLTTTPGVVAPQFPNAYVNVANPSAGVVLRLNATATALDFASYLPGTDNAGGLAIDPSGNLWIAGETAETTLPVSANAYQKAPSTGSISSTASGSGYIMELAPGATSVLAATYLDGTGVGQNYESSSFSAIGLDSKLNVFVGGTTSSPDFPMQSPFVTVLNSTGTIWGMMLAEMSPDLSTVKFGSFLNAVGNASYEGSNFGGMTVDPQDHLIAAGTTFATDFPTTAGSFEPTPPPAASPYTSYLHSFVAKIDMSVAAPALCFSSLNVQFGKVNANTSSSKTVQLTNCGNAALSIDAITSSASTVVATQSCGSIAPGVACPIQLTFTPVSSASTTGSLTFSTNAATLPKTVAFGGQGIAPSISAGANPVPFGHYLVGTAAPNGTLALYNRGQVALTISSVTVSGSGFALVNQTCTTRSIAANSFCVATISFTPISAGPLTGTVTVVSNDPQTPQLTVALTGTGDAIYPVPMLSSLTTPTVPLNTATIETLTGSNFYPQSVAQLNGTPLTTKFVSNTTLQATIPAGAITALGEQILTVVNPQPAGGISAGLIVTPYQTIGISPTFLVSVPSTGLLYAANSQTAASNPNTVIPIDPTTGTPKTPIAVGNKPGILAATSDGSYLYVANQTDLTVQRINLSTNAVERTFPYTPNLYCSSCTNLAATDLATVPGYPQQVLMSQGSWLTLYNDSGAVNHIPNDGICCMADPNFGSIALAGSPLTVYALPFLITGEFFQTANLTPAGLSYTRLSETNHGGNTTTGNQVISDGTLLYTSAGQIWSPATRTEVGTFPVTTYNATSYPNTHNITLDSSLGEFYTIGDQTVGSSSAVVITAYGLKSHAIDATLLFPQITSAIQSNLVRWGTNGFAFLSDAGVYLVKTSAVSASTQKPSPVLNAISPASVIAGGSSFIITVSGSSFLSNSVIDWNGTPLPTTFVSGQQLTATVPASNLSQAGTAQVAVYTPGPGGGSSVSAAFTINGALPGASLSPSSLDFANVTLTLSSSAQPIQLTNTGNAPLAISGVAATGDFSETNTCGASLAAGTSCTITVLFTPSATGSRTGTLTVTDNAPTTPQTVTLAGTGVPTLTMGTSPGGSTTSSVSGENTATYALAIAGGTGFSGTVKLTCTGAPQYATCDIAPSTVTITSGSVANYTVTVSTGQTMAARHSIPDVTFAGLCFTPLFALGILTRRKRRFAILGLSVLACLSPFALSGCSSGSAGSNGSTQIHRTPAGTYNLTISASVGSTVITQGLVLIVN
ncbi:choice-of-anchor D domain-containing protein [Terriglobus sp. 2YAB30_2]